MFRRQRRPPLKSTAPRLMLHEDFRVSRSQAPLRTASAHKTRKWKKPDATGNIFKRMPRSSSTVTAGRNNLEGGENEFLTQAH
jgi:hypothetical protein